jgi:hypothetical protein
VHRFIVLPRSGEVKESLERSQYDDVKALIGSSASSRAAVPPLMIESDCQAAGWFEDGAHGTTRHDPTRKVGGHLDLDGGGLHGHPWASELWVDPMPPYRSRLLWRWLPMLQEDVSPEVTEPDCWKGVTYELGGTSKPVCTAAGCEPTLIFRPPNTLRASQITMGSLPDPVQALRDAIAHGLAHDEGTTQLGGRTVQRIRLDPPPDCDADQGLSPPDVRLRRPRDVLSRRDPQPRVPRRELRRAFPHLRVPTSNSREPRTTDIRAQHPNAPGP